MNRNYWLKETKFQNSDVEGAWPELKKKNITKMKHTILNCYYKGCFIINTGLVSQLENKKKSFL